MRAASSVLDPKKDTVAFCNTGHLAATDWFVMSELLGQKNVKLLAKGTNLREDAAVDLGADVSVTSKKAGASGGNLALTVDVAADATPGARMLTITNPDCSFASYPKALTIEAKA